MNLVEWWLVNYPENAKTPDHWKCRAEPVYALKDATGVFMDFIEEVDTDDRVALVIYNGPERAAMLEQAFTDDFDSDHQHRQPPPGRPLSSVHEHRGRPEAGPRAHGRQRPGPTPAR